MHFTQATHDNLFLQIGISLHPTAAGRVYAAYGGVYVAVALAWLWLVDGIRPTVFDVVGVLVIVLGTLIIVLAPKS